MKVTIALATYNVATYLRESLDRIVGQTLRDLEILCIDDASTDGTVKILREYAETDARIRLVEKTSNEGLAVSRNMALQMAQGEYVCFVDGDDLMDMDLMERAYNLAVREQADEVMWDYYEFGEHLFAFVPKDAPSSLLGISPDDRHTLVGRMAFIWTRLFKTQSIRELGIHFPEGRTKQDQPVHWLTTTCLNKIALLPERKYAYRISSNQTSTRKGRVLLDVIQVSDYTEKVLREHGVLDAYSEDFYHHRLNAWWKVYMGIKSEHKAEALSEIRNRYKVKEKYALQSERRQIRWFYQGVIEGQILLLLAFKTEEYLRKLKRKNYRAIMSFFRTSKTIS